MKRFVHVLYSFSSSILNIFKSRKSGAISHLFIGFRCQVSGFRYTKVSGVSFWPLVTGLATCHWFLVAVYWPLVSGFRFLVGSATVPAGFRQAQPATSSPRRARGLSLSKAVELRPVPLLIVLVVVLVLVLENLNKQISVEDEDENEEDLNSYPATHSPFPET
jgi:hypothetical protein